MLARPFNELRLVRTLRLARILDKLTLARTIGNLRLSTTFDELGLAFHLAIPRALAHLDRLSSQRRLMFLLWSSSGVTSLTTLLTTGQVSNNTAHHILPSSLCINNFAIRYFLSRNFSASGSHDGGIHRFITSRRFPIRTLQEWRWDGRMDV